MKQHPAPILAVHLAVCVIPAAGQAALLSPPPAPCEPVNPNATPEARALCGVGPASTVFRTIFPSTATDWRGAGRHPWKRSKPAEVGVVYGLVRHIAR